MPAARFCGLTETLSASGVVPVAGRTESQAAPSLVLAVAVSGMALTPVVDACTCCAAGTAVPMT